MRNVNTLMDIARYIKTVPECNSVHGVVYSEKRPGCPACLAASAYRAGVIGREVAVQIQGAVTGCDHFEVNLFDWATTIFAGTEGSTGWRLTGMDYYRAIIKLLRNHNRNDEADQLEAEA